MVYSVVCIVIVIEIGPSLGFLFVDVSSLIGVPKLSNRFLLNMNWVFQVIEIKILGNNTINDHDARNYYYYGLLSICPVSTIQPSCCLDDLFWHDIMVVRCASYVIFTWALNLCPTILGLDWIGGMWTYNWQTALNIMFELGYYIYLVKETSCLWGE